jgi:hypothetical protein
MGRKCVDYGRGALFHVVLFGSRTDALVQDEMDWRVLGSIAKRVLWWCRGCIHGCRCEGKEVHFALEVSSTPVWSMLKRIEGAYAQHLWRTRGWTGTIFEPYLAIPVNGALYLTDLVVWLHGPRKVPDQGLISTGDYWTGDEAYIRPGLIPWITAARVLDEFGQGAIAVQAYRRRKMEGVDPEIVALLNDADARQQGAQRRYQLAALPSDKMIETIARVVACLHKIPYAEMYSKSRRRDVSKAKAITAVLAVRRGASLAKVASLFHRRSSTLIENAERYHTREPQVFEDAEVAIAASQVECLRDKGVRTAPAQGVGRAAGSFGRWQGPIGMSRCVGSWSSCKASARGVDDNGSRRRRR